MAARFWVGGTGTWDNAATTNWSTTSGGAGGSAAPTSADAVTFDGNSGASAVITVNANVTAATVALGVTGGNFVGTLDFATNNNSPTFGTFAFSGAGTRTLNLGSGTMTLNAGGTVFDITTQTGLTLNAGTSTVLISNTPAGTRSFVCPGKTLNNLTVTASASSPFLVDFANTAGLTVAGTLTFSTITNLRWPAGTITAANFAYNGTSSKQGLIYTSGATGTLSTANANAVSWIAIQNLTVSGAGSLTATNSFDAGGNTNITITAPSGGGAGAVVGQ